MTLLALALLVSVPVVMGACARGPVGRTSDGRLGPCPSSPNCVSSEADPSEDCFIPPFEIGQGEEPRAAFERLLAVVGDRARLERRDGDYAHAVFVTRLLRFRDDVELRLDAEARRIHVRSASRLGYSDLGANRKRVEALREAFRAGAPGGDGTPE